MSIPAPYSEVYLAGDGVTTVFAFGTNFKPISAGLVKCSVYLQDGYEVIPTYTVDMEGKFITISALTLPDSTVLTAPPAGSTVRIYRDMPEEQDITASQLQAFTAKQLEVALDAIVAMIQEVSYTTDHKMVRLTEPQRDIALQELGALEDEHLIYWDNTTRKLVVTNYPQKDVVRCVNGLFFRLRTDPDTQEPYLQWSTDESDWHSINIDEVELQAQGAYALAGDAYTLAYATRGELNTHKGDHSNPHETSLANLIDTNVAGATGGQFLQYNGINWVPVSSTATVSWGGILGNLNNQTDLKAALDGKVDKAGDTMTGALNIANIASSNTALLTLTHSNTATYKWNIAPRYNSTTLSVYPGSTETNGFRFATTGFVPSSNNARYLGSASLKWKGVYTGVLNNGADLVVPNKAGTLATMGDVELAAQSGTQLYSTGVWYAKMRADTRPPAEAEVSGRNYADFSGRSIDIYVYDGRDWTLVESIQPPEYDGYITVTSKIWDIEEQAGQQGGRVLWNHTDGTFTPYPLIVSFEDINVTGDSTVVMPQNPGANQIVNKDYVDEAIASIPTPTVDVTQSIDAEIVGTLTITDNSIVSGFSNSNYLKLPGVFELGSSDTNSFEIGASFTTTSVADSDMKTIITGRQPGSTNNAAGIDIRYADISDQKIRVVVINGTNQKLTGTTNLSPNTKYYIKFEYDGTDYKLWLSTDGASYSLEVSAAMSKLATPAELLVGKASLASPQSVDMAGLYIKKNGQIIWQGMDAPGLHQRVAKGHEVVAFQAPKSTNNYTWYRKYADGWVEQGGLVSNGSATTGWSAAVVFPIEMSDTNYSYQITPKLESFSTGGNAMGAVYQNTTTGFTVRIDSKYSNAGYTQSASWQVSGMAQ